MLVKFASPPRSSDMVVTVRGCSAIPVPMWSIAPSELGNVVEDMSLGLGGDSEAGNRDGSLAASGR